jgi:hypothetical protein
MDSIKFRVASSIGEGKEVFNGVVFDYVIEPTVGQEVSCLGGTFRITQVGKILVLVSDTWVLTLEDISVPKEPEKPKLVINDTLDVYLESKEIVVRTQCTYVELYNFLVIEWETINKLLEQPLVFPLELQEHNSLLLKDSWELLGFEKMTEGSYTRQNAAGRSI